MNEAINFIKNYVNQGDTLILGISGGPDSMALLHLLYTLKDELNINLVCAHINHNVRKESNQEQIDLNNYCNQHNITFECIKIDKWENGNFENQARNVRYEFFEKLINKYNAKYLLTAHHGDDLIETILMRMVRGSSLKGYAGFARVVEKPNYKILRPFITLTKDELVNYCNTNNIKYAIDKTNLDDIHTRNRYRKYILPKLKEENKNVHLKFFEFSKQLLEYDNYIKKQASIEKEKVYINNKLSIYSFNKLDDVIKKTIINSILEDLYGDLSDITSNHVDEIFKLIASDKPNSYITLPNNIIIKKQYDFILVNSTITETTNYNYELVDSVIIDDKTISIINDTDCNSNFYTRLNTKELTLPLYVRNRCDGDKMCVKNMTGSKKIKDIFIDSKIGTDKRDNWPIVVDANNTVVWIPGIKKSKYDDKDNYNLVLEYK